MKSLIGNQKCVVSVLLTLLIFLGISGIGYGQALNVGEPRTIRLFYFLPNDRPYRQEVVDAMKTGILEVQSFYREQMEAHGHGAKTFQIETDTEGVPMVHRVDGDYPDNHYSRRGYTEGEVQRTFDNDANITFIVMDITRKYLHGIGTGNKKSGFGIVYGEWDWYAATHEIGHAFGLAHDFRLNSYIMSYGRYNRSLATISEAAAEFLSVHPYFNAAIPLEIGSRPSFELLSSTEYPLSATSVPIQIRVKADNGLHQIIVLVNTKRLLGNRGREVKAFHKFAGETDTIFEFDYDGLTPSDKEFTASGYAYTSLSDPLQHKISFILVDKEGNNNGTTGYTSITLEAAQKKIVPVSERTPQVRDAIVAAVPGINSAADVTEAHLAGITALYLSGRNITSLKSGDFEGLTGLEELLLFGNQLASLPVDIFSGLSSLHTLRFGLNQITMLPDGLFDGLTALRDLRLIGNQLTALPDGIFEGLTGLTLLNLGSNSVDPLRLNVSLEKVVDGQFKAVLPAGAPFDIVLPISVSFGNISGGATMLTIPAGSVESEVLTVTHTPGSTFAATVDIGALPALPTNHSGYSLVKSSDLPLAFTELGGRVLTPVSQRTLQVRNAIVKAVPGITAAEDITQAHLEGITSLILGSPPGPFGTADPETSGTTSLQFGDFDGLIGLKGLSIVEENLSAVPAGVFDGLVSLEALTLSGIFNNLPTGVFDELVSLKTLSLGGTFSTLPLGVFDKLTSLETLTLGSTNLNNLPSGVFEELSNLTTLFLLTPLKTLPVDIFDNLPKLTKLLVGNKLDNLPSGIFNKLTSLINLSLWVEDATQITLPAGIIEGFTSLTSFRIESEKIGKLPLTVSLEKMANGQFKAVTPAGAPFDIVLPLTVTNGSISGGITSITIPVGSVESEVLTVASLPWTTDDVTVNIGTLPNLPQNHSGYELVKSADLPLVYPNLAAVGFVSVSDRTPQVRDAIVAAVPGINSAADVTEAHLAAITFLDLSGQSITSLNAYDFSGLSALTKLFLSENQLTELPTGVFNGLSALIGLSLYDNQLTELPTGVFKDLLALDLIELSENQLTELPAGVFSGLSALSSLYLSYNQLTELPTGVFSGLSSLTEIDLRNNAVDPLPLTVSLEKVAEGQFKAVAPTGAPFDIVLQIGVRNGATIGGATSITISAGDVESEVLTITRPPGATIAATVHIDMLSGLPVNHSGYVLVKSTDIPIKVTEGGVADTLAFTMTVGRLGETTPYPTDRFGFNRPRNPFHPHGFLSTQILNFKGNTYTITTLYYDIDHNTRFTTREKYLVFQTRPLLPRGFELYLDSQQFNSAACRYQFGFDNAGWNLWANVDLNWSTGQTVQVRIVETTPMLLGPPTNLQATTQNENIMLTWKPPANANPTSLPVNEYELRISDDGGTTWVVGWQGIEESSPGEKNNSSVTINSSNGVYYTLSNGTEYTFEVRALGGDGYSDAARVTLVMDEITPMYERTPQVRDAIVASIPGINSSNDVTGAHLATITSLNLRSKGITHLKSRDFAGLFSLTDLNLYNNQLSSLPDGIFKGLTALRILRLGGNTVDPMLLAITLEKVGTNQFRAVVPTGAPFNIVLPITVTNGTVTSGGTTITIPQGSVYSDPVTVTRTVNTTAHVTVDITALPNPPFNHYGYELVKSADLPIVIIRGINTAPVFTDGTHTTRSIAENTSSGQNIGIPVSATDTDGDKLVYTLGGTDAAAFSIDTSTGQLRTLAALDYETKASYSVTVTVSDGYGDRDNITVNINVTDVSEILFARTKQVQDAIVAAAGVNSAADVTITHLAAITELNLRDQDITSLTANDFDGLTNLTSLDLSRNQLETLPPGIFDNLTTLTSLSLWYNRLNSVPAGIFDELTNLTTLNLQQNRLTSLPANIFDELTSLTNLHLLFNNFSALPSGIFDKLTSLTELEVSGNYTSLPSNIFDTLTSLTRLSLQDSKLTSLPVDIFENLTSLQYLTLHNNQLTALPSGIFDKLTSLTGLSLANNQITELPSDIFKELSLFNLFLNNNKLTALPDDIFEGLTFGLNSSVRLQGNPVDPLPITISVKKVAEGQFKATFHTGATFNCVLPLSVTNGSINGGATSITIDAGSAESDILTVTRTTGTTDAVTVNIGTLPNLPHNHIGYALVKSSDLPLTVIDEVVVTNNAPVFTDGDSTTRSIAENTDAGENIGAPVSATDADGDTLTYTLSGTDAAAFSIVSTSGQLRTKAALDYETKASYTVKITVSDGSLTAAITVTINIVNIDEVVTDLPRGPVVDPDAPPIYWVDWGAEKIQRVNLDGSNVEDLVSRGLDRPVGIALDVADGKMYWTDYDTRKIQRANLDGSNVEDLITRGLDGPGSIALDVAGGKMYWTDGNPDKIRRANLDGSNVEDLVPPRGSLGDIALDVAGGKMYWTSLSAEEIRRANLDGSNVENLVSRGLDNPSGIALDVAGGKMYWTDWGTNKIQRANLDGSKVEDLVSQGLNNPGSIALDVVMGKMYWIDWGVDEIQRANLDGSNVEDLVTGLHNPADIALGIPTQIPTTTPNNAPIFTDGNSTTRSIAENTDSGENIGDPVSATDADNDVLTYSLGGTDASSFSINSTTGQLKTKVELDYETKTSYTVTVSVSDVDGGSDRITVTINVTDVDEDAESPISLSNLTCSGNVLGGNLLSVRIGVTVTANERVRITNIIGYINNVRIGSNPTFKTLNAGETSNFSVTGIWNHDGSENPECSAEVEWETFAAPAAPVVPLNTTLLPNYPNPFNPETWIPYHLAKPADVTISIYNVNGQLVRTLAIEHQPAGMYQNRSRAAYWDGKNAVGEPVASGVYFYTLTAGDFTATRKMLIRK